MYVSPKNMAESVALLRGAVAELMASMRETDIPNNVDDLPALAVLGLGEQAERIADETRAISEDLAEITARVVALAADVRFLPYATELMTPPQPIRRTHARAK